MSYMIWPFIYEALLPRLLTLTLCRQVMMIITSKIMHIISSKMPDETEEQQRKNQPSS
jgi:hypothetical protein